MVAAGKKSRRGQGGGKVLLATSGGQMSRFPKPISSALAIKFDSTSPLLL